MPIPASPLIVTTCPVPDAAADQPAYPRFQILAAHTTNDVVAWVPERKLLFAGDLVFNGGTPFVVMGSVSGAIAAVERLKELAQAVASCEGPIYLHCHHGKHRSAAAVVKSPRSKARVPVSKCRRPQLVASSPAQSGEADWAEAGSATTGIDRASTLNSPRATCT